VNCIFSNPVTSDLSPASSSAAWAFQNLYCDLTSSASATLSSMLNDFNNSMHNYEYTLFLAIGILLLVAGFWIGQWLFKR